MSTAETRPQLVRFWKKLLRLTRGRVTVLRALEVIGKEETDPAFREVVEAIRLTVEKGSPLSAAALKHPAFFSHSVAELLKTAEKCGAWDEILQEIAEGLEDGTFD